MVQSDIDEQAFQVQKMLADELDYYKGRGNDYVDANIKEFKSCISEKKIEKKTERWKMRK